ncbi:MAG TPA: AI-2E family transporter [Candidatus Binatia bacterium]|nr:AI-2E family transporter [Candidatus Binatia bacterium]
MATLLVAAVLYVAREVFIPFALALLLSFLLAPLVAKLQRLRLPKVPAVVTVVSFAAAVIAAIGWLVSTQLYDLANKLPNYQATITQKLKSIRPPSVGVFGKTSKMIKDTGEELSRDDKENSETAETTEKKPIPVEVHAPKPSSLEVLQRVLGTVLNPLAAAGIVTIFVIFMLIYMDDMRDRLLRLIGMAKLNVTTQALDDAATRVSRYLFMNLVVNMTYGIPIGLGLYFIGVPNAVLWGVLATLLRFIPYIGPWVAACFPVALAFAVDPGWTMFISTIALFIVVELISNNVVEPWLYGASTGLSPIAVIVAAVFWTWLWGPVGLFLSTPLTVCLAVIGRYFPHLDFFYILLADEPVLPIETRFYQRLVARDPEDAATLVKDFLKDRPLVALYDGVILPALSMAEAGRQQRTLHEGNQKQLWQNTRALVAELADHVDVQAKQEGETTSEEPASLPPKPEHISVACIPARGDADEIAATIVAQLLERRGVGAKAFSDHALAGECIDEMHRSSLSLICICTVGPPAWKHVKYLCKRLCTHFPDVKLIVMTWGAKEEIEQIQQRLGLAPEDLVVKTIGHAVDQAGLIASNTESIAESQAQENDHEVVRH